MDLVFRYTQHQVARGAHVDHQTSDKLVLIKNTSSMRLTYQIRLLTFLARESNRKLAIEVPKGCKVHANLRRFVKAHNALVRIERV